MASGRYLLAGGFADPAGRDAYLVAFHAALEFTVAQTGKEPKTHHGAQTEFARLARQDVRIGRDLVAFLSRSHNLKTIADYDDGEPTTVAEAEASLDRAEDFLAVIVACLERDPI